MGDVREPKTVDLSVVVPLYNEEESIAPLYRAIVDVLDAQALNYEIVFVDDGSSDGTFPAAERLAKADKRLRVIKFRRNFGQTPAMAAGIQLAAGRIVVTMDGDLQNDPRDIPTLLRQVDEGYDIVVGWRFDRKDNLLTRRIPSRVANWLMARLTGMPIKDTGCSLKAFRADVIKKVQLYSEMHRFIPAMASLHGPRIAEVKVHHHPRRFGKSKYGLSRVYDVLLHFATIKTLTVFATRPLKWFATLAAPALIISFTMLTASIVVPFHGASTSLPLAGAALFFMSLGVYLVFSGVLAELVYRTGKVEHRRVPLLTPVEIGGRDGDARDGKSSCR